MEFMSRCSLGAGAHEPRKLRVSALKMSDIVFKTMG
jgi:hypothetical protein